MSTSIENVETAAPPSALMNGFSTMRAYWSPGEAGAGAFGSFLLILAANRRACFDTERCRVLVASLVAS